MVECSHHRQGGLVLLDGGFESGCESGRVRLVGAGPGDPDLLTIKAARALGEADVVVYDRLTPEPILALARPNARLLYVGKRKARHALPQDDINALLVGLAREGFDVVRLKGGDPFVFGRGGEELAACRAAGVPCEVIPGISAGLAAAAAVGAPVTHRGVAQAVTFVTGHAAPGAGGEEPGEPALDWAALAKPNHTVVVYMGLSTAPVIAARLIAAGRSPGTPVVLVENASLPNERRLAAALGTLGEAAKMLEAPTVLVIGEVAAMADTTAVRPCRRGDDQPTAATGA